MASSRLILGKTFQMRHFVGAILCVIGASCVMSLDVALPKSSRNHNRGSSSSVHDDTILAESGTFIGDSFALIAALLFGLNDCLAEYTIQNSTPDEYLAMMGVFGFLFSFCESIILERNQLQHFCCMILKHDGCHEIQYSKDSLYPTTTTLLEDKNDDDDDNADVNLLAIFTLWAWYIATFYTFYASASRFLRIADATLLSLSLQTSNLWTMIFSVMVQDFALSPFFLCSSAIILFGVWLYERGPPPTVTGF
jgi:drug/metabolite transporter (DMT)-like permease